MNEVVSQLLDMVGSLQDELQQLRGRVSELEAMNTCAGFQLAGPSNRTCRMSPYARPGMGPDATDIVISAVPFGD